LHFVSFHFESFYCHQSIICFSIVVVFHQPSFGPPCLFLLHSSSPSSVSCLFGLITQLPEEALSACPRLVILNAHCNRMADLRSTILTVARRLPELRALSLHDNPSVDALCTSMTSSFYRALIATKMPLLARLDFQVCRLSLLTPVKFLSL
jgi:hypothetical protein